MATQAEKYHLAMAGEYFVAAQLQRLNIAASVTYGNAKSADVVAFSSSSERAVLIEVKSTSKPKWVVGGRVPHPADKPWVFVLIPELNDAPPRFFILTQTELHNILAPLDAAYDQRYKEKHGVEYGDRPGVINLTRSQAEPFENNWEKIVSQLKTE